VPTAKPADFKQESKISILRNPNPKEQSKSSLPVKQKLSKQQLIAKMQEQMSDIQRELLNEYLTEFVADEKKRMQPHPRDGAERAEYARGAVDGKLKNMPCSAQHAVGEFCKNKKCPLSKICNKIKAKERCFRKKCYFGPFQHESRKEANVHEDSNDHSDCESDVASEASAEIPFQSASRKSQARSSRAVGSQ
jgi:hypothetical protein